MEDNSPVARIVLACAAVVTSFLLGYLAHRPPSPATLTRVEYRDRVVVQEKRVEVKGDTRIVTGPVRREIHRVLVAGRCEETITETRAPVTTERRTDTSTRAETRSEAHTEVRLVQVPAKTPTWLLGARAGLGARFTAIAGVELGRCAGWLCASAWGDVRVPAPAFQGAGLMLGVRW